MSNISHALPIGTLLSNNGQTYRVVQTLGAGGFGITYLVESQVVTDGRVHSFFYAMKEHFLSRCCEREQSTSKIVFSKPVADEVENSLRDFVAEAARLQKVGTKHNNIVKVRDIFTENNTAYYIMEYLQGDNLQNYVKSKGRLTAEETYKLMEPIIDAVGFLHSNKMTHLDIKPQNIMLTPDPRGGQRPVLIDFGLSKHYDDNGTPTSTINTLGCSDGYSPIEQYAGITTFSPTADIYALGATMAFCLSGHNPSKATDVDQTEIAQYVQGNGNVGMAVGRMMQPSRNQRPQSIAEVYSILNAKPEPTPVRPTPPPVPPTPPTPPTPPVPPVPPVPGSGKKGGGKKPVVVGACILGGLALIAGILALIFGLKSHGPHDYDNDVISQYYDPDVSSGGSLPYPSALTDPGAPVAVTLQWRQTEDLDLYVVQPDGQVISWDRTSIASTDAYLSQDAMSTADRKEETAYWYAPMAGTYDVFVSDINEPSGVTTCYVGILNDGNTKTYTVKIDPACEDNINWRAFFKVASFTVGNVDAAAEPDCVEEEVEVEPVADGPDFIPSEPSEPTPADGIPITNANRNDGHFGTTVGDYARANTTEAYDAAAVRRANNAGPSAPLKFTLLWDASNDLDLIVNMPSGSDYVYYGNTSESASGGRFGGDATGGSGSAEYVTFSNPPSGIYDAFVRVRGSVPSAGEIVKLVVQNGSTTKVYTTRIKRTGTEMKDVRMCTFSASGSGSSGSDSSSSIPTTSASASSSSYSSGNMVSEYIPANTSTAYDSDAVSRASSAPGSGPVKVVLLWNFSNDCDLIVNQANMTDISYSNRNDSSYGAHHSGDNTGSSGWNSESIYWTSPGTGIYDVFVRVRGSVPSNGVVKAVVKNGSTTTTYATRIIKSTSDYKDFRLVQFRYNGDSSSSGSGSGSGAPVTNADGSTTSYSSGNMVSSYVRANTSTAYDSEAVSRANSLSGSGPLKVSLLWDFSNDLDLIVNTNNGTDIYYNNSSDSATGAHHSGDNRGGSSRNSESAYWTNPAHGVYDVFVRARGTISNKTVRVVVKNGSNTTVYTTSINKTSDGYKDIRICQFEY